MTNSFHPTFDALPDTIPIFPLPQALLLPRATLPLNIFEPRYLAMTSDALGARCRLIGMIQPDPSAGDDAVYGVGCAGRIALFQETDDGRYIISLAGVSRFRIVQELDSIRGYRRVQVSWEEFKGDLLPSADDAFDVRPVTVALKRFSEKNGIKLSWETIERLPPVELVNAVSQSLPLGASEKQLLLEVGSARERAILLAELLTFDSAGDGDAPRGVH